MRYEAVIPNGVRFTPIPNFRVGFAWSQLSQALSELLRRSPSLFAPPLQ